MRFGQSDSLFVYSMPFWQTTSVQNCRTFTVMNLSRGMGFPTMLYVRQAKPQISLRSLIRAFAGRLNILRVLSY